MKMELAFVSTTNQQETLDSKTGLPGFCPNHKRQLDSRQSTEAQMGLGPGGFIPSSQPMQTPLNINSRIERGMRRDFTFSGGRKEHYGIWAISGIVHPPEYVPLGISLTRWRSSKEKNRMC
ncbi:unnamed protein product [Pipistrellus nathusii]|uniref:Uncharacterized protein n=1 Tax=Pipistrellus nathusii TaxID=59473 RepID=A0ABN9Z4V1_PIPNA